MRFDDAARSDAPMARVMAVIAVEFRRGKGVAPNDPVRMVMGYYSLEGELLAERDSWPALPADRLAEAEK